MKKIFLSSLICVVAVQAWALTTITTGNISGNKFCGGTVINVPYTVDAPANAGNLFTAQLSDDKGSFVNHANIGILYATGSGSITSTIPWGSKSGTKYRIRVVASDPLIIGSINTKDLKINPKPGGATVSGITSSSATYSWNLQPNATNYRVRVKKTDGTWEGPVITLGIVTTYTFTGLEASTSYDFQVRAECANDELSGWKTKTASTTGSCGVPVGGVETGNTPTTITYDWNNVPGSNGYIIRTRITSYYYEPWIYSTSMFSTVTVDSLFPATDYESQIAAICGSDTSEYSALIFGNTTYRLSYEANASSSFSVFPNPSDGEFSLQFNGVEENTPVEITIQNVYGQTLFSANRIYKQGLNEEKLSIPDAVSGMYLVKVKSGDETFESSMMVK